MTGVNAGLLALSLYEGFGGSSRCALDIGRIPVIIAVGSGE